MNIRVRFAPSPTGFLHLGSARTALFNYLFAKKHGGKFILRVEDTDAERCKQEYEDDIFSSLSFLGITFDEGPREGGKFGPYRQKERMDIYEKYAHELLEKNVAYPCYCTEEELALKRELDKKMKRAPRYDGTCRNLADAQKKEFETQGRKHVLRFKVPADAPLDRCYNLSNGDEIVFRDLVHGGMNFNTKDFGDFVIVRANGTPVFLFSSAVDDALMQITHVIRGEDHLSNTPLQMLILKALGLSMPQYAHIPVLLAQDRSKLSKRHGAVSVREFKDMGYLKEALVNCLVLLSFTPRDTTKEFFALEELCKIFELERMSSSSSFFDIQKLKWMNAHYIRHYDEEALTYLCIPHFQKAGLLQSEVKEVEVKWLKTMISLLRESAATLTDIVECCKPFFQDNVSYSEQVLSQLQEERTKELFLESAKAVEALNEFTHESLNKAFGQIAYELNIPVREVFRPVRLALTGQPRGPEMHKILKIYGKEKALKILRSVVQHAG